MSLAAGTSLSPLPPPAAAPAPGPPPPPPIRYAEKRRTSTCRFADRIAQFCVDHYREHIPASFRETQKQTCLAAIVALVADNDGVNGSSRMTDETEQRPLLGSSQIHMVGMGVGTKFLSHDILKDETKSHTNDGYEANDTAPTRYGRRVRDCHAEVLARRAFRRQLLLEILRDLTPQSIAPLDSEGPASILQREEGGDGSVRYQLRPGVSLHMYASSAPCGNATLKKFASMKQERFRDNLSMDEWPTDVHEPMIGHSIRLGQFALLVKKDPGASAVVPSDGSDQNSSSNPMTTKKQKAPALQTTDWCPPGTSTVWSDQGSIHTCSDKLCRWNCLGLQGSLLASLLGDPLYLSSLTVGRKLTECICRRAVCCRAAAADEKMKMKKRNREDAAAGTATEHDTLAPDCAEVKKGRCYRINHPAIMGTQVYMDETGVIDMSHRQKGYAAIEGQDVRFHNTKAWAWWPSLGSTADVEPQSAADSTNAHQNGTAECIDGATGFALVFDNGTTLDPPKEPTTKYSRVSTAALLDLHIRITELLKSRSTTGGEMQNSSRPNNPNSQQLGTLADLRTYKKQVSPEYETQKHELLTRHPLFRQWKRREQPTA